MKRLLSALLMVLLTLGAASAQSKKTLSAQTPAKKQTTATKSSSSKSNAKSTTSTKQTSSKSAAKEEVAEEPALKHMLGFSAQAGYGGLQMTNVDILKNGFGLGAGLGFVYQLQYKAFRFQTGLETDWYGNQQNMALKGKPLTFAAPDLAEPTAMHYYQFDPYTEQQLYGLVNVPVLLGAQVDRFYFLLGAKVGVSPWAGARFQTKMKSWIEDPAISTPQMALTTTDRKIPLQKVNTFSLFNVTATGEIGLCLDKKVKAAPAKGKSKNQKPAKATFAGPHHCYLAVFGDYGVLDAHKYTPNKVAYMDQSNVMQTEGGLIYFDGLKNQGVPSAAELNSVQPHTIMGHAPYQKSAVRNWMVGLKFTYVYDITKKSDNKDKDDEEKEKAKDAAKKVAKDKAAKDAANKDAAKDAAAKGDKVGADQKGGNKSYNMNDVFAPDTIFIHDTVYITVVVHDTVARPGMPGGVRKFNFSNLFFAFNQTKLLPQSRKSLGQLYSFLDANPAIKICVVGHTDNRGTVSANQYVSEGRARNIRDYMIGLGIEPERIQAKGKGMSEPLVPNDTPEHMQQNRRVEIIILNPEVVPNLDEILTFNK